MRKTELSSRALAIAALEGNLWSLWANFGRGPGCFLIERPDVLRFDTPIAQAPYNAVMRFCPEGDADPLIDTILAHYAERDVPLMWVIHPTARPVDLPERLKARGFVEDEGVMGMVGTLADLPTEPTPPGNVQIIEAGTGLDAEVVELVAWRYRLAPEAADILRAIYRQLGVGSPGANTRIWIAMQDGRPISKAVLHIGAGVAGLHGVATRPEARGLGLARLLTLRAFHVARAQGATSGVLHATPMATSLYSVLGFKEVAPFRLCTTPGSLHL